MALTVEQSAQLCKKAKQKGVVTAVNFNYRYYPTLQYAHGMVKEGEIGKVNIITGGYLQDWLLYDTEDYNWRLEPEIGGTSRAMVDIGSHWCDLAEHISGMKITAVMANLLTVHGVPQKPL